jgi:thiol:disulfide interchange protein DsbD
MRQELSLNLVVGTGGAPVDSHPVKTHRSSLWDYLAAFIGGLLTDFTPCVLPIIPLTLAFIGVRREKRLIRNLGLTSLMILSMALSYAILGVIGASVGRSLGFLFQGVGFSIAASLLYLVLAAAFLGWIPFQAPASLQNWVARLGRGGMIGALGGGATIGILAAPCIGPVIASLLIYVAQTGDLFRGFWLLFVFGLGMGTLFLVLTFFEKGLGRLLTGQATVKWGKRILASLLLVVSLYYAWVALGQLRPNRGFVSFWITDPAIGFLRGEEEQKPIFIDFFATWCLPCLEMERQTFSNDSVQDFLKTHYVPLKIDCTSETPTCKSMIDRFGVIGWPTYLIVSPDGKVRQSIVGQVIGPEDLVSLLSKHVKGDQPSPLYEGDQLPSGGAPAPGDRPAP